MIHMKVNIAAIQRIVPGAKFSYRIDHPGSCTKRIYKAALVPLFQSLYRGHDCATFAAIPSLDQASQLNP
jgi:hypothetical protein